MNQAGEARAEALAFRTRTALEERQERVRSQNMALLCHCSAEIDESVRRYFSVNGFYLGRTHLLVLASDFSPPDEAGAHVNVYRRTYVYALIEEVIVEALTGHFTFYTAQLDGRLAVLLTFLDGLGEAESRDFLRHFESICAEITARCRALYDLNVVLYVSQLIPETVMCASVYSRMASMVTLHRFAGAQHITPVLERRIYWMLPPPTSPRGAQFGLMPMHRADPSEARTLACRIVSGEDPHPEAAAALARLLGRVQSVDSLKGEFGLFVESLCAELRLRGLPLNEERWRREVFELSDRAHDWDDLLAWFHALLDGACERRRRTAGRSHLEQVERACLLMRESLSDSSLNVEQVAAAVGMRVSAFTTAFESTLHCSPSAYLRRLRLEKAAELLRSTSGSVASVAAQCGFGSLVTFHRVFKDAYGLTPAQMRSP